MSSRTSRAIRGTLASGLQYFTLIALQAVLTPAILRIAGQETLGAFAILMQALGYLTLVDLGFGVALSRYLSQAYGHDDQRLHFQEVFTTGRTYYLCSNTAFALLVLILYVFMGNFFSISGALEGQARTGLIAVMIWSVVRTPFAVYGSALIATQNLAAASFISLVGNSARLFLSLAAVLAGTGLTGLMLSNIGAELITFTVSRWYFHRVYPLDKYGWGIPNRPLFREMIRFGIGYLLVIIAGQLAFNSHQLIIGSLFGPAQAAIYYVTQMPAFLLFQLIWKVADNAAPGTNELYGRQALGQLRLTYLRILRYSLLLVFGLALGLLGFNRVLISLWVGPGQYAGGLMTGALSIFAIATVANHVNALIMVAYGAVRSLSMIGIVGGVSSVICAVGVGKMLGIQGVMVGSAIVESMSAAAFLWYVVMLLRVPLPQIFFESILPAVKANLFVIPVLIAFHILKPPVMWQTMLAGCAIFSLMWLLGVASAGLQSTEISQLHGYLKGKLSRA